MSQQQMFTDGNSPVIPDVQYIMGTTGTPAGPDPVTFTVTFTSDSGDFIITSDAGTYEVDFALANKYSGSATTVDAATADLITLDLGATPGTFQIEARVKLFESTEPAGGGYNLYGTFITDGVTATLIGEQEIFNEDPVLSANEADFVTSGNNAILRVTGVLGYTIDWVAEMEVT